LAPPTAQQSRARQVREQNRQRIIDAATELVRERSYAQLNVGEVMTRAGIGRTIFYRHFDDLGDLLLRAGREAVDALYEAQLALAETRMDEAGTEAIRQAIELTVAVYRRHGPVLRAVADAVAADELVAAEAEMVRGRFDDLVADTLRRSADAGGTSFADPRETAHALNVLNERYLLDAFGRRPRVSAATAIQTLTEIWIAALGR
jgi:AcrR family transcriptional regulator